MTSDLFSALLDRANPRGQPLLAAMLYAYCPAAARWWLNGVDPRPVFDPLWFSLSERAAGHSLAEVLDRLGFSAILADVKKYLARVEAYRSRHPSVQAPELASTFPAGRLALQQRIQLRTAIETLGGDWRNFERFIHAWAFVFRDWSEALQQAEESDFGMVHLELRQPGLPGPVRFPAWRWTQAADHRPVSRLGMIGWGAGGSDLLRLELALRAGPPHPPILLLGRKGSVSQVPVRLEDGQLSGLLSRLARQAAGGPYPPLPAFAAALQCLDCGFQAQCYTPAGDLTSLVLEW